MASYHIDKVRKCYGECPNCCREIKFNSSLKDIFMYHCECPECGAQLTVRRGQQDPEFVIFEVAEEAEVYSK